MKIRNTEVSMVNIRNVPQNPEFHPIHHGSDKKDLSPIENPISFMKLPKKSGIEGQVDRKMLFSDRNYKVLIQTAARVGKTLFSASPSVALAFMSQNPEKNGVVATFLTKLLQHPRG